VVWSARCSGAQRLDVSDCCRHAALPVHCTASMWTAADACTSAVCDVGIDATAHDTEQHSAAARTVKTLTACDCYCVCRSDGALGSTSRGCDMSFEKAVVWPECTQVGCLTASEQVWEVASSGATPVLRWRQPPSGCLLCMACNLTCNLTAAI
jgi:hypothetical protein